MENKNSKAKQDLAIPLNDMNVSAINASTNDNNKNSNSTQSNYVPITISNADDLKIYTSGATNIFKYPELSDSTKASELIYALEEKKSLTDLVSTDMDVVDGDDNSNHGIQVYIGNETPVESMKDCSVVTATYELQDGMKGTIGMIGPKRMDYEKVMNTLKDMRTHLDEVFKNN